MNPRSEEINYESTTVGQPGRHLRQQVALETINMNVDRYGVAHDTATNQTYSTQPLSQENVATMVDWQDYIAANMPLEHDSSGDSTFFFDDVFDADRERAIQRPATASLAAGFAGRFRHALSRSRAEVYYLPHSAMEIAARGLARMTNKAEAIRTGVRPSNLKRAAAWMFTGAVVTGAVLSKATAVYANTKYGIGSGSFESHGHMHDLLRQHMGSVALHGSGGSAKGYELMAEVTSQKHHLAGAGHHEAVSAITDARTAALTTGEHQAVSQITYDPARPGGSSEVSTAAHHRAVSEIKYDPIGQHTSDNTPSHNNGPGQHHRHSGEQPGRVFIDYKNGYTQEYVQFAQRNGISLSGAEAFEAYNYVNDHIHGHFLTDNPSYRMADGNWGISHPGWSHWSHQERFWFHHWLITNGKISK